MDQLLVRKLREHRQLGAPQDATGAVSRYIARDGKQIGSEHPVALNPDHDRMSDLSVHKLIQKSVDLSVVHKTRLGLPSKG